MHCRYGCQGGLPTVQTPGLIDQLSGSRAWAGLCNNVLYVACCVSSLSLSLIQHRELSCDPSGSLDPRHSTCQCPTTTLKSFTHRQRGWMPLISARFIHPVTSSIISTSLSSPPPISFCTFAQLFWSCLLWSPLVGTWCWADICTLIYTHWYSN